jgi:hypothetical protein
VEEFVEYFENEAPSILSSLLRTELQDRICLSEYRRGILDEAVEQTSSRFASLLRPGLDRLGLPRLHARSKAQPGEDVVHGAPLVIVGPGSLQLPSLDDALDVDNVDFDITQQHPALDDTLDIDNVDFDFTQQLSALDGTLNANYMNVDFD